MIYCTIFDSARLGALRGLTESLREHEPSAAVLALYVGDESPPVVDGVEVIRLDALGINEPWRLIAASSPDRRDETLLGPLLAEALRRDERVVYLSTTMRVCAGLDPVAEALDGSDVVLLPMIEGPLPDDGCRPSESRLRAAAELNPRLIAVRRSDLAGELIAGWPQIAEPDVAEDEPLEFATDSVSEYLDRFARNDGVALLDDPGVGFAFWNAGLRKIGEAPAGLTINDTPLRLLDITGISAGDPAGLWSSQDRIPLKDHPVLARKLLDYADQLWASDSGKVPPFLSDHQGRSLGKMYRGLIRDGLASGALTRAPWTDQGGAQWAAFLDSPAAHGLTRHQLAVWQHNAALQAAFPDLDGDGGRRFSQLLDERGAHALPALAEEVSDPDDLPWGVNVAGFFRSQLGLGQAARLLTTSLREAGVPALAVHGSFVPATGNADVFEHSVPSQAPYPINIISLNGELIDDFAREEPEFFAGRHNIAMWWWELVDAFPPDWHEAFEHLDEIWVASDQVYDAIAPHSPVPVNKVRMPVEAPRVGDLTRAELGFPSDGFIFLYVYDYHSSTARKNPVGHVEAFKAAFGEGSGAKLVLKCINGEKMAAQHLRTELAVGGHPDITVIDRFASGAERDAMIGACDCYLSLHRSEGFGLTPAEAMAIGKPVIATRYGGVLDFMSDTNSYLVDHGWTTVGPGGGPYPADATWAEPDLDHAARLMREVFDDQAAARERGEQARIDMRERHAPEVAGELMRAQLEAIHSRLTSGGAIRPAMPASSWNRTETRRRIETPVHPPAGRAVKAKQALRQVTGRLIQPFLDRQRGVDQHLLWGIDHLHHRFGDALKELHRFEHELRRLDNDIEGHQARHDALPYMTEPWERWEDPQTGLVEGFRSPLQVSTGSGYHAFEHRFRGTRERIRELQRPYVELLREHQPVLDCGCGRGELLELLAASGITASGIDLDEAMLGDARALGLDVSAADAVETLNAMPEATIGAVTAMQVIEHLPEPELIEFLRAARRSLRAGGRLIVETVNPHSVVALKAFWLDPTHQHPLFPEVVLELCREAGFDSGFVFYPGGTGDVETDRHEMTAYAVVADVAPDSGS